MRGQLDLVPYNLESTKYSLLGCNLVNRQVIHHGAYIICYGHLAIQWWRQLCVQVRSPVVIGTRYLWTHVVLQVPLYFVIFVYIVQQQGCHVWHVGVFCHLCICLPKLWQVVHCVRILVMVRGSGSMTILPHSCYCHAAITRTFSNLQIILVTRLV